MRTGAGDTTLLSAPRAKCPLPDICAVTTSPGAVRGTNTTSPLLLPTPSPPAAIESMVGLGASKPELEALKKGVDATDRRDKPVIEKLATVLAE